ncbi:MAG: hypothetical protein R3F24_02450 [Gammaproteobacteria bacterium]
MALALTISGSLIVGCGIASADTLLIQNVDAENANAADRPRAGSSMTDVEARFGAPASRSDAIGKPPITRWDYPGFVVYFEYNHVIHAVRR